MTLRHIRPRSSEWYEALLADDAQAFDQLAPEQVVKLRCILEAETATLGMPPAASRKVEGVRQDGTRR